MNNYHVIVYIPEKCKMCNGKGTIDKEDCAMCAGEGVDLKSLTNRVVLSKDETIALIKNFIENSWYQNYKFKKSADKKEFIKNFLINNKIIE